MDTDIVHRKKRWYTGTPCNFKGNDSFFSRDSGLTSRGFEMIGIESRSVTLGPAKPDDLPAMIRATWEDLTSPKWWRSLGINGIVFYTWGNPKYRRMVEAAKTAGIQIAQVADQQGIISPIADWKAHLKAESNYNWHRNKAAQYARFIPKIIYSHTLRLLFRDRAIARTIASSDLFFCATPNAEKRYRNLTRWFQGQDAANRIHFVPLPVNSNFRYSKETPKENEVVAVGRWESHQKRLGLLLGTINETFHSRNDIRFRIFGTVIPELLSWHESLPKAYQNLVTLEGVVPNVQLTTHYQKAKVILVASAFESFHIASAEAICCGASVVACRSPFLDSLEWQASKKSGRLAEQATPISLAETLLSELDAWDQGERDPVQISRDWTEILHPDKVAAKILKEFDGIQN